MPVLVVALGIALALAPLDRKTENEDESYGENELYEYVNGLESRLEAIISEIFGAGNARVMITLESSFENVYASNARLAEDASGTSGDSTKNTEREIALVGSRTGEEEPVLLKSLCPKIKGVMVVCQGAENEYVVKHIREAVSVLFGISEARVSVICGKGDAK